MESFAGLQIQVEGPMLTITWYLRKHADRIQLVLLQERAFSHCCPGKATEPRAPAGSNLGGTLLPSPVLRTEGGWGWEQR